MQAPFGDGSGMPLRDTAEEPGREGPRPGRRIEQPVQAPAIVGAYHEVSPGLQNARHLTDCLVWRMKPRKNTDGDHQVERAVRISQTVDVARVSSDEMGDS